MAILRAMDGTFFEVPDDQLENFKVPAEKIKEILGAESESMQAQPPPASAQPPQSVAVPPNSQVVIQVFTNGATQPGGPMPAEGEEGDVKVQGRCGWRNWSNWRNCY